MSEILQAVPGFMDPPVAFAPHLDLAEEEPEPRVDDDDREDPPDDDEAEPEPAIDPTDKGPGERPGS